MSRVTVCETVPGIPKVLNKCLLTDEYTKWLDDQWWGATFMHSFSCSRTFIVLPVRLCKMCFWGSAPTHPSAPGCEFWAPASQLPWCWLFLASPLGISPGPSCHTSGPSSWHPQVTIPTSLRTHWAGIPLWTGTELYSSWHWHTSPSGAKLLNDDSIRASTCQHPLSELGFSYESQ